MSILEAPTVIKDTIVDQPPFTCFGRQKRATTSRVNFVLISGLDESAVDVSDDVAYLQIERFVGSVEARKIWRDWLSWEAFGQPQMDKDLKSGLPIGYRVRYKDADGNISAWSSWTKVVP
jgi:hypothetical protein